MSEICNNSGWNSLNFVLFSDISVTFVFYNRVIIKKGRKELIEYEYFTDNRFKIILWYRTKYYKGTGWCKFFCGRRWICSGSRHFRFRKIHDASYDGRFGHAYQRKSYCTWRRTGKEKRWRADDFQEKKEWFQFPKL